MVVLTPTISTKIKNAPFTPRNAGVASIDLEFGKFHRYEELQCFLVFSYSYCLLHPALTIPISLPPSYPLTGNQRCPREGGNNEVQWQLEEGADPFLVQKTEGRGYCCCCCYHGNGPCCYRLLLLVLLPRLSKWVDCIAYRLPQPWSNPQWNAAASACIVLETSIQNKNRSARGRKIHRSIKLEQLLI